MVLADHNPILRQQPHQAISAELGPTNPIIFRREAVVVGGGKVCLAEVCPFKNGAVKVAVVKVDTLEVGAGEVCFWQLAFGEGALSNISVPKGGELESATGKVDGKEKFSAIIKMNTQ